MDRYVQETLAKGLLDMDLVSDALENFKARSFHHQLNSQAEDVKFDRFDIDMSEFKFRVVDPTATIIRKRYIGYVEFDMISRSKKLRYKRSPLYRKEISLFDIKDHRDIFDYNYLAFINGRLVDFIHIIPSDTGTTLVFNRENAIDKYGLTKEQFDELMRPGVMLSIFFLPNTAYGAYTLDAATLNHYNHLLSLQDSGIGSHLDSEASYISFITSNKLGFNSTLLDIEKSKNMLKFFNVPNDQQAHVNIFGFKYLYKQIELEIGQNSLYIDYTKMPVPVENIIPFEINEDGSHTFAHNITIQHQYPDMYTIEGRSAKRLKLLVFYNTNIDSFQPEFVNEIGIYLKHMRPDHPLSNLALTYKAEEFVYSISDFEKSRWYPNYNAYKLSKFTEWYMYNKEYLRDYLKKRLLKTSGFYIDVSQVKLEERVRLDNHKEIEDYLSHETFNEERYVFILRNEEPGHLHARIYIDGLVYKPDKVFKRGNYEYYYIPTTLVTETSIIDIERYEISRTEFHFKTNPISNHTQIHFGKTIQVAPSDVVITDRLGNIIDKSLYTFYYPAKKNQLLKPNEITAHVAVVDKLYLEVKDETLRNKEWTLHLIKNFDIYEFNVVGKQNEEFYFDIEEGKNPARDRIFVYYNRRLIPPELYHISYVGDPTMSSKLRVRVRGLLYNDGDNILIYRLPVSYDTVLFDLHIPGNGVLDLRGRIKLPYDLQWYDTFINGRFIDKRNIDILSPNMVALKNILLDKNLLMLTKADYILGLFDKDVENILDKLFDSDKTYQDIIEDIYEIDYILPEDDYLQDSLIKFIYELKEFFENELMKKIKFINPDLLQFTSAMAERYPSLITNPNGVSHQDNASINIVMLNPDNNVKTANHVYHIKPEIPTE